MSVAAAMNGKCVAIAGSGAVEVLDNSGLPSWRWEYGQTNRFIKPGEKFGYITPGGVAVSPTCDTVAIVGYAGYPYVWIGDRGGRRISIHTTSTPLSVGFDRRGEQIAIGTGGRDVFLYSTTGELKWKTTLQQWCCVVRRLSFSKDNRSIVVHDWGVAVLRVDGSIAWASMRNGMNAADDLQTFVAWWEPNHGPGIGRVFGLDDSGHELWSKFTSSTGGVISPDGSRIIVRVNQNQQPTEEDGFNAGEQQSSLQVLSRKGELVATLPSVKGAPIAISPDGSRILLSTETGVLEMNLTGKRLFEIPVERSDSTRTIVADDFSGFLIVRRTRDVQLQWYSLK
jgi:hypothetical protein